MGYGQHDFLSCLNQFLVFKNGLLQLTDCAFQPFFITVYTHHIPVYHHIGPYQQQNHECRQTDDRGK